MNDMRVALMNYIISRQRDEPFILRIEDMQKEENIDGKDGETKDIMKKFAIEEDQLFYQSDKLSLHQKLATSLLEQGKAFACICTPEELEANKKNAKANNKEYKYKEKCSNNQEAIAKQIKKNNIPFVLRIHKPKDTIKFHDLIRGDISMAPNEVDSFVILRADGTLTYDFATACDDMLMDISLIIRKEEYFNSTPKQIHIKQSLAFEKDTKYAHLPSILNDNSKNISDVNDSVSIKWLLEEGFLPDAIINYLLSLGDKTPQEIFLLPDTEKWFDIKNVSKTPIKFDIDRLRFINRKHLEMMDNKTLSSLFNFADVDIGKLAKVYLGKLSTLNELKAKIKIIFTPKSYYGEWAEQMKIISRLIIDAPVLDTFNELKKYISEKSGLTNKELLKPLGLLITGEENEAKLSEIYPYIKPYITEIVRCN